MRKVIFGLCLIKDHYWNILGLKIIKLLSSSIRTAWPFKTF